MTTQAPIQPTVLDEYSASGPKWSLRATRGQFTGSLWFNLAGDLGVGNRREIRAALLFALKQGERRIVLDLRSAGHIGTSGLSILIQVAHAAQDVGAQFTLDSVNADFAELLEITRIADLIPFRRIEP